MAGDWIKWVKGLPDKPEVVRLAGCLGLEREFVACRLMRFWGWCDENIPDSEIRKDGLAVVELSPSDGDNMAFVDEIVGIPNFAKSLAAVGWIRFRSGLIELPNFGRHNGKTAKTRARNTRNQSKIRDSRGDQDDGGTEPKMLSPSSGDKSVTRGEERVPPPPLPPARKRGRGKGRGPEPEAISTEALQRAIDAWNAGKGQRWGSKRPPPALAERLAEPGWLEDFLNAIARISRLGFYCVSPPTLSQALRPEWAQKVNGGDYDSRSPAKQRGGPDERPRPKFDRDWEETKRATEAREAARRLGSLATVRDVIASRAAAVSAT